MGIPSLVLRVSKNWDKPAFEWKYTCPVFESQGEEFEIATETKKAML